MKFQSYKTEIDIKLLHFSDTENKPCKQMTKANQDRLFIKGIGPHMIVLYFDGRTTGGNFGEIAAPDARFQIKHQTGHYCTFAHNFLQKFHKSGWIIVDIYEHVRVGPLYSQILMLTSQLF